jgi:hypothetical protein
MILAQLPTPSNEHITVIMWAAATILSLAAVGLSTFFALRKLLGIEGADKHEIGPQPLVVKPAEAFIPRSECLQMHAHQDHRVSKVEGDLREIREQLAEILANDEARSIRIHDRLERMQEQITNLPSVLVALLRNTGALK